MRAFKKALMAFAAVTAVSAAFAATSFAADLKADYAAGKVTITAGLEEFTEKDQITVLLIKEGAELDDEATPDVNEAGIQEGDILYINQAAGNVGFGDMGVKGGELADGNYTLMVGSDVDGLSIKTFTVVVSSTPAGREIQLGECDGVAGIDMRDPSAILQHIAGTKLLEGDYLIAADCDGVTGIDMRDPSAVLQHIAGTKLLGKITVTD